MDREAVMSSNVEEVGYDEDTMTLEVLFRGGSVYQYYGVPANEYRALIDAPSVGRRLATHIKGVFRCERME